MAKIEQPIKHRADKSWSAESETSTDALYTLLARQPFLFGLEAQQLQKLASLSMPIRFRAGQFIFQQGDPANRFYLLLEGKVQLEFQSKNARPIPLRALKAGDDLGWSWLIAPYSFQVSARTVEPTRAIFFYGTFLRQLCEEDHELGYELLKRVAEGIAHNFKDVREVLTEHISNGLHASPTQPALMAQAATQL